ncbi:threonine synthase [Halorubrum lacusprofundi]|jgi:threonine synthase|uniref:Pyridoxal-5'-phosphate-dependent protein beta subunit n=1 Tax=Halorubrum lacusprofundi (strain ATCC 49239 / DSM 5036 / JCM 8891 / ACAM 34) TaxID=416348 RepID=B9LPA5_HALLT|nr:threonine synthase [Halorubrum lacusprofundi]ACM57193.1 Pyridoxal-5'-phosphate-dependent protein beta subunit [Halorubrum lacusprofundi ATCC 49239]MCG1007282.1 threonine synthase [Halorubrum lacusprofundi]
METTDAFTGLSCVGCGGTFDPETATHQCPDCGGILDPAYDLDRVDLSPEDLAERPFESMWRYGELLPFAPEAAVSLGEGATPLVECPALADAMGVGRVLLKDEGANPTGTFKDRGQSLAMTAARQHGAADIALNSAGNAGQAAAAYAARADLDAHVYLPSRAGFTQKAMTEVHGADLTVTDPIDGNSQIGDAGRAYADAMDAHPDWYSAKTFVTPYRHEGKKTMALELLEQLDWEAPDGVVYPTGGGVGLVGMHKAAHEVRELGWTDELVPMYAAQAAGCAPVVDAYEAGADRHEPVPDDEVDTACNGIAIPDPGASPLILDAIRESEGGAVATTDREILDAAIEVARAEGLEVGATCAACVSGAFALAESGEFGPDDTVVLLNTGAGNKDVDALRAHLGEREVEAEATNDGGAP